MSDETVERPPQPKPGHPGAITRLNPCGDVILWPWPLELHRGTTTHQNPKTKTKETRIRYAVDNLVAIVPPKGRRCPRYDFMQFVQRTGTDTTTGNAVPRYSHSWHPDIKDWDKRPAPTFLDPSELIYDPTLVTHDPTHDALIRRDGPGYEYPPGHPPKNLRLRWDFKLYVICHDAGGALKVVGLVEFGFEIVIDAKGVPTLNVPSPNQPGYPQFTAICCNTNDAFDAWIDQWHAHNVIPGHPLKSLRTLYSLMPKLVDESVRTRRTPHALKPVPRRRRAR